MDGPLGLGGSDLALAEFQAKMRAQEALDGDDLPEPASRIPRRLANWILLVAAAVLIAFAFDNTAVDVVVAVALVVMTAAQIVIYIRGRRQIAERERP